MAFDKDKFRREVMELQKRVLGSSEKVEKRREEAIKDIHEVDTQRAHELGKIKNEFFAVMKRLQGDLKFALPMTFGSMSHNQMILAVRGSNAINYPKVELEVKRFEKELIAINERYAKKY